ncbi:hypothetical protein E2C01_049278 [Portunus trituberculatus]|uniref:Uncharacterized protein n=1 Tax=Portunus trituberculatus TaxID=210409 RepID=A0A5B7GD98_PORTR|nr:hypothetical protein [Portunus trituberculatus]
MEISATTPRQRCTYLGSLSPSRIGKLSEKNTRPHCAVEHQSKISSDSQQSKSQVPMPQQQPS